MLSCIGEWVDDVDVIEVIIVIDFNIEGEVMVIYLV